MVKRKKGRLTKKEEQGIAPFLDKWVDECLAPSSDADIVKWTREMCKYMGKGEPVVHVFLSPRAAQAAIKRKAESDNHSREEVFTMIRNWYIPTYWNNWSGYYNYCKKCGIKFDEKKLELFTEFVKHVHIIFPFEGEVYVVKKPKFSYANGILHNDNGPAVEFEGDDGCSEWILNNVVVPREIVETPAEQLDPLMFSKIENAEIRREFIRKIGVERLCQKLGSRVIDKSPDGVYELHVVNLGGSTGEWPYLKMKNPSINVYHMEAVSKDCATVEQALAFRNGGIMQFIASIS